MTESHLETGYPGLIEKIRGTLEKNIPTFPAQRKYALETTVRKITINWLTDLLIAQVIRAPRVTEDPWPLVLEAAETLRHNPDYCRETQDLFKLLT